MTANPVLVATCLLCAANFAAAATPSKDDYANGIVVNASYTQPMLEITLPDSVYQTVTRADLGDLRVFNADGVPVPHAFCAAPATTEPVVSEQPLPVYELRDALRERGDGPQIEVETAGGTRVNVQTEQDGDDARAHGRTHIIDARDIKERLRAIRFDWQSPDGASSAKVRIEASGDLDRWLVVVPSTTLLLAKQGDQEIRRERIELPPGEYSYLRVQRADGGPPLLINAVIAEHAAMATDIEPLWFMPAASVSAEEKFLLFDAARAAPVSFARLRLPQENSSVRVVLESRPDEKSSWRERWSGESYVIVSGTDRRESPPARFDSTTDRYWRVQVLKDPQVYRGTLLELGYRPARLRFLAQGPGPFTLAFGSHRAEIAHAAACNGLLADVSATDRERMVEIGSLADMRSLGGEDALKPLPKKTPLRLVLLWSVLVGGVGLLIAMALSLLKRVRPPG
jgi:hypothetical protein